MANRRAGAAVALLVVLSAAVRARAAEGVQLGWIAPDEAIYALLGRSLWETGSPSLLGGGGGFYSLVYPALVGLPLAQADVASVVTPLRVAQALALSATAAAVYMWGRPLLGGAWSLLAAGLTLAIPGLAYAGLLMTEVVAYPLGAVALWALASALGRPAPRRQALAVGAIVLALLTHPQMAALLPAVALAVALQCLAVRGLAPARRQLPLLASLAALAVVPLAVAAATGSASRVFGVYSAALGGYELHAAAADVVWHAAAAYVLVAGVPLVALALLTVECLARRETDPRAVALVCTAAAWTIVLVLEVGIFASRWVGQLAERDLLTLAPPLFLVFALWLARGLPRPPVWTPLLAVLVAAPAVLLPVRRFAVQEAALDSFSSIPLWRLAEATSPDTLELVFATAAAALAAAAVLVPRRVALLLPLLVVGVLVTLSVAASRELRLLSDADQLWTLDRGDPAWVDAVAEGPVTYLHGSAYPAAAYKLVLWNRRVEEVVLLPAATAVEPFETEAVAPLPDGLLLRESGRRLGARLVVAPAELELVGSRLASTGPVTDLGGLALWRIDPPARVRLQRDGFYPNGDIVGEAEVRVYGCERGRLEVTLLGKDGLPVDLYAGPEQRMRRTVPPLGAETVSLASPRGADGSAPCSFRLVSAGLVGTTRIEYVPEMVPGVD